MPRMISTTWFEDIGYFNQPIMDFKLIRLSIRQTIHLFLWSGLAYLFYSRISGFFFSSWMVKAAISLALLVAALALFARRGKVFTPEWYLYKFIRRRVGGLRSGKPEKEDVTEEGSSEGPETGPNYMVAPMGEPTRIAGVLYSSSSGERLSEAEYEVRVDGESYYSGKTDQNGEYSFIYTPPGGGVYDVEVYPEGASEPVEKVEVEGKKVFEGGSSEAVQRTVDEGTLKTEGSKKKETTEDEKENHIYELSPTNFINLSAEEQNNLVDSFRSLLNSLDCKVKIVVKRTTKEIDLGDRTIESEFFKHYIVSEEPIDAILDGTDFLYQRTTESPEPNIVRSLGDSVAVKGGRNQKTGTVYKMGEQLIEGFPAELYSAADRMTLTVDPIDQGDAVDKMERFMDMKDAISQGGGGRKETSEAQRAREALDRLSKGGSRLFKVVINVTAGGDTEEEMEKNYEELESSCKGRMVSVEDERFFQKGFLRGELGKELYLDTVTLGAFFPFVSSDVMEPHGVFLGLNRNTGAPVIYDPLIRSNGHMAIIGQTGSGKSMSTKIYLTRLFERYPSMSYFIIDPENEYTKAAVALDVDTDVFHVSRSRELGLDPLKLFESKDVALSLLTNTLSISSDEPGLLSTLRKHAQRSGSLDELRENLDMRKNEDEALSKRLEGVLDGPEGFLFRGESQKLSDRAVIDLSELHQALKISDERTGTLHIASLLVFGQIWKKIEELPRDKLKVVVVDEVWLYTNLPAAASFLEYISRRGRRRNVVLVLASQRPADVLESDSGRAAIENCGTKVMLQQDKAATGLVSDAFELTEQEVDASTGFSPGECVLTGGNIRATLKWYATPVETRRFTTTPGGE